MRALEIFAEISEHSNAASETYGDIYIPDGIYEYKNKVIHSGEFKFSSNNIRIIMAENP